MKNVLSIASKLLLALLIVSVPVYAESAAPSEGGKCPNPRVSKNPFGAKCECNSVYRDASFQSGTPFCEQADGSVVMCFATGTSGNPGAAAVV